MLEGWKPPRIAWLGKYLLGLAVFIRKPEMPGGENYDHASHMGVQARFFMWSVVDVHYLNILILKC